MLHALHKRNSTITLLLIISASLSSVSTHGTGFSRGPSVGLSVSPQCIVVKWLSGSRCHLGWWVGWAKALYKMGAHVAQGEWVHFGVCPHWPNGFNGLIFKRNVFNSCVKSWEYFRTDNTLLGSMSLWLSDDIVRFRIERWAPMTLLLAGVYCACTLLVRRVCKRVDV